MNNLAETYGARKRHDEAKKFHFEAIRLGEKKLGPKHPVTLKSKLNLAICYAKTGDVQTARGIIKGLLYPTRMVFGEHHKNTKLCEKLARACQQLVAGKKDG